MWIEMRCENRDEPNADDCHAHKSHEGLLTYSDKHKDIMDTVRDLERIERGSGGKKIAGDWYCSNCVSLPDFKPQQLNTRVIRKSRITQLPGNSG